LVDWHWAEHICHRSVIWFLLNMPVKLF
jgi:hypothetical protein